MLPLFAVIYYWGEDIIMKQVRIIAILAVLCMILPLAAYAQDHRHSRSAEIRIVNNTDTQVTLRLLSEKYGSKKYTYAPGERGILTSGDIRLRVRGDDQIELADWGTALIRDIATFEDGLWNISIRQARRMMRNNDGAQAEQFYKEGKALEDQKSYAEAVNAFSKAIERKPDYADAFFWRGFCYYKLVKYDNALRDFNKVTELTPDEVYAYTYRGLIYISQKNYDRAILEYTKAIEVKPEYAGAYDGRGVVNEMKGDYNGALRDYERSLDINPNNESTKKRIDKLRTKMGHSR
jgi:tetratricopeptide (TPR) repeat protein